MGVIHRSIEGGNGELSLLGFGLMRLPIIEGNAANIDYDLGFKMIDYAYEQGVTYFDTAWPYHEGQSEIFAGKALCARYPRESFKLATKCPVWLMNSQDDVRETFEEQLRKCQTDHFDLYLMHSLNRARFETAEEVGVFKVLDEYRKAGKIGALGFSFHSTIEDMDFIAHAHDWDFAQIQLNYLDWTQQNAEGLYKILTDLGIPVTVMEPVRGGALAALPAAAAELLETANPQASPASWALRFAASLPNVQAVLSGMSTMEQMEDNVATFSDFKPLDEADHKLLEDVVVAYSSAGTIPCTGCRYCMDCPSGVDIPRVFAAYNHYHLGNTMPASYQLSMNIIGAAHGPDMCTKCETCLSLCPQHIAIPDKMEEIAAEQEEVFAPLNESNRFFARRP
ncbi:MAG: aldo/keto reductase [Coriobacteriia bacterium]|nr:aldo/keto reductase [Coriobacteriia bacterium]